MRPHKNTCEVVEQQRVSKSVCGSGALERRQQPRRDAKRKWNRSERTQEQGPNIVVEGEIEQSLPVERRVQGVQQSRLVSGREVHPDTGDQHRPLWRRRFIRLTSPTRHKAVTLFLARATNEPLFQKRVQQRCHASARVLGADVVLTLQLPARILGGQPRFIARQMTLPVAFRLK